jgi:hypothetical protein
VKERAKISDVDPDLATDANGIKLPPPDQTPHCRRADAEEFGHLSEGEQSLARPTVSPARMHMRSIVYFCANMK